MAVGKGLFSPEGCSASRGRGSVSRPDLQNPQGTDFQSVSRVDTKFVKGPFPQGWQQGIVLPTAGER